MGKSLKLEHKPVKHSKVKTENTFQFIRSLYKSDVKALFAISICENKYMKRDNSLFLILNLK